MQLSKVVAGLVALLFVSLAATVARADTIDLFDTRLATPYNVGTGNDSNHFATSTYSDLFGSVELGLRIKTRFVGDITPTGNVYYTFVGESSPGLAIWNFDYSAGFSGGMNLSNTQLLLGIDFKPAVGNSDFLVLDFGNGAGSTFQDSQNLGFAFWQNAGFFPGNPTYGNVVPFNPNAPGEYKFTFTAIDRASGDTRAFTSAISEVNAVPLPPAAWMGLIMFGGFGVAAWRRRRRMQSILA